MIFLQLFIDKFVNIHDFFSQHYNMYLGVIINYRNHTLSLTVMIDLNFCRLFKKDLTIWYFFITYQDLGPLQRSSNFTINIDYHDNNTHGCSQ